ncbi:glycerate kinase [Vibrio cholerae]|uniref:glycerate kinase n=1 Tax=Vibrio TaxID=662 RepID=UPI00021A9808|nr:MULTISPECIES: glycerate kinase [Vibrio]EGS65380.1 putative glycerate kinase 2 [Vibrio paracholerae HE-09]EKG88737.1 putative glycerate kinase 2 [Vibrio paracholerae HE-16]EMP93739.1 glycerate kinase [Vibrio paracholerae 87395]MBP8550109.1 glycerate kinase [Vibrio paracholerae]MBW5419117.1 glycerate kinase [Vibrio cholerae]
MKVVIAPDSFKESLTAKQVCDSIQTGLARIWHDAKFVAIPVADGGEGTVQSLVDATQGRLVEVKVMGPQGKRVEAFYGMLGDNQTAVIEMAAASGLHHVPLAQRDPKLTTSFGTGELIRHALDQGVTKLIIGLGGSATNDGGVGMLAALGARFTNADGEPIQLTGGGLRELTHIDLQDFDPRLQHCDILVACDVNNPLCGDKGASAVFGPQKGATPEDAQLLDDALLQFGLLTAKVTGKMVLESAGAGAAGGMGAALLAYTQARLRPGIEIVLETVQLAHQVSDADLVITGEGRIDSQTVHGKTPMGVAKVAKRFDVPVLALCGCTGDNYQAVYQCGIDAVFAAVPRAMSLEDALKESDFNLADLAENVARLWVLSK